MNNEASDKAAQEERFAEVFAHLREQDIEQFYAHYQLWVLRRRLPMLEKQLESLREHLAENQQVTESLRPSALALAVLVRLQSNGVNDIDVLDLMLDRGEDWLDRMMQRLDYCEQVEDFIQGDYNQWCIRSLEGAYDWIDSLLGSIKEEPGRRDSAVNGSEATEELLLQKLSLDDEEAMLRVTSTPGAPAASSSPAASTISEQEPGSAQNEQAAASHATDEAVNLPVNNPHVETAAEVTEEQEAEQQAELIGWKDLEDLEAPGEAPLPWYSVDVTANGATSPLAAISQTPSMDDWIKILQADASDDATGAEQLASETNTPETPINEPIAETTTPAFSPVAEAEVAELSSEQSSEMVEPLFAPEAQAELESDAAQQEDLEQHAQAEQEISVTELNTEERNNLTDTTAASESPDVEEISIAAEVLTTPDRLTEDEQPETHETTSAEQIADANSVTAEESKEEIEQTSRTDIEESETFEQEDEPAASFADQEQQQAETPPLETEVEVPADQGASSETPVGAVEPVQSEDQENEEVTVPTLLIDQNISASEPGASVEPSSASAEPVEPTASVDAAETEAQKLEAASEPVSAEIVLEEETEETLTDAELQPSTSDEQRASVEPPTQEETILAETPTTSPVLEFDQPQTSEPEASSPVSETAPIESESEEAPEEQLAWYEYLDLEKPVSPLAPSTHEEHVEPEAIGESVVEGTSSPEFHEYAVVTQSADEQSSVPGSASVKEETIESENWQNWTTDAADEATLPLALKEIQQARQMLRSDGSEKRSDDAGDVADKAESIAPAPESAHVEHEPSTTQTSEVSGDDVRESLQSEGLASATPHEGLPIAQDESTIVAEQRNDRARAIEEQPTLLLHKLETPRVSLQPETGATSPKTTLAGVSQISEHQPTSKTQTMHASMADAKPRKKRGFWWRLFHFGRKE